MRASRVELLNMECSIIGKEDRKSVERHHWRLSLKVNHTLLGESGGPLQELCDGVIMSFSLYSGLPELATVEQVVDHLQVSERTVRKWIADGVLPAYRVGSKPVRIRREALDAITSLVRP